MLQAIDLTKRYEDGNLALDALNLEIKPGEIFFLLGANGAGKTTSINIFLKLHRTHFGPCPDRRYRRYGKTVGNQEACRFRFRECNALRQLHRPSEPRLLCPPGR